MIEMPMDLQRGFMIIEKIEECYRAAHRLFGNEFTQKTKAIRDAMKDLVNKGGCSTVSAGLHLLEFLKDKKGYVDGMEVMLVCAVTYDMCKKNGEIP